jgi:hypothetical protein
MASHQEKAGVLNITSSTAPMTPTFSMPIGTTPIVPKYPNSAGNGKNNIFLMIFCMLALFLWNVNSKSLVSNEAIADITLTATSQRPTTPSNSTAQDPNQIRWPYGLAASANNKKASTWLSILCVIATYLWNVKGEIHGDKAGADITLACRNKLPTSISNGKTTSTPTFYVP